MTLFASGFCKQTMRVHKAPTHSDNRVLAKTLAREKTAGVSQPSTNSHAFLTAKQISSNPFSSFFTKTQKVWIQGIK